MNTNSTSTQFEISHVIHSNSVSLPSELFNVPDPSWETNLSQAQSQFLNEIDQFVINSLPKSQHNSTIICLDSSVIHSTATSCVISQKINTATNIINQNSKLKGKNKGVAINYSS